MSLEDKSHVAETGEASKGFLNAIRRGPNHWMLDWDGTLTRRDTLDALVNIAKEFKPEQDVSSQWNNCVQAYLSDYEAAIETHALKEKPPTTIDGEVKLLKALEDVERNSVARVSASGIFRDLDSAALHLGAKQAVQEGRVQMRKGWNDFLMFIESRNDSTDRLVDRVDIISVNWSQRFIASCLRAAGGGRSLKIYANELEGLSEDVLSTGVIGSKSTHTIISSGDKREYMGYLTRQAGALSTIYVGDSWTDFECLMDATVGICVRDTPMTSSQKKLDEAFQRLGISCPHIDQLKEVSGKRCTIAWVKDFNEIRRWLGD
ncbi:hypothetical protein EJ04DRAFT_424959 [Polyplosphaeria fusca]|uniref:Haloacid dehalogenase-like hydrolase n=1 Tax=Polyplosphaeria fusca TaxID=682080 RepID=A0A9P4R7U3_9PLEO|nr:hypothetical protein EJ04DRAFT_424959 [Polyplosphaeria fusca]